MRVVGGRARLGEALWPGSPPRGAPWAALGTVAWVGAPGESQQHGTWNTGREQVLRGSEGLAGSLGTSLTHEMEVGTQGPRGGSGDVSSLTRLRQQSCRPA